MTNFAILNHKKIAYSKLGNTSATNTLVFVHGLNEDRSLWNGFVDIFFEEFLVFTVDVGGYGESELPEDLTITKMAEQVNAVLEAENIARCYFVGHSMGGYIAVAFAAFFGKKLAGMVMFHSHPFEDTSEKKASRFKTVEFIDKHGTAPIVRAAKPSLFSPTHIAEFQDLIKEHIEIALQYDAKTVKAAFLALGRRPDRSAILENMNCPVLLIIGKDDKAVSWEQSQQMMVLPKAADIQVLENVGHMGMFEAPTETQQMIFNFVKFSEVLQLP